ncbi:hypothetical protein [Mangrovicoccus algicola]|uniref:Apolipoprotein acyltransferase n=1 Tax=Mangrovicoccus algicola TaxID=2771008 RepID=A0A8J7CLC6_9RHOB|nr:hypothetical protein [Mangrovicoccus algicola]MBE3639766.1 hypothetical protein [Mangrovicoccus algicola]
MIVIVALLAGAAFGGLTARRRGGNRWDIAQYAAVCAIIGAILGLTAAIWLQRAG